MASFQNQATIYLMASAAAIIFLTMVIQSASALDPMVDIQDSPYSPEGKSVHVHVPMTLDLRIDTKGPPGARKGFRLTQNVLYGLVQIFIDREPMKDSGRMTGPIQVKVMGVTVFNNGAVPLESSQALGLGDSSSRPNTTPPTNNSSLSSITSLPSRLSKQASEAASNLVTPPVAA